MGFAPDTYGDGSLLITSRLWHSRRLASPDIYGNPTEEELTTRPPAFHRLVQKAPNGEGTLYIAAHLKTLFTQHGKALENSQEIVWELIRHCTQPKVKAPFTSPQLKKKAFLT